MTAPVAMTEHAGGHTVTFMMPEGRTLASLPVPLDSRVQLRELPARRVAVLRFSGAYTWEPVRAQMGKLLTMVERAGWRGTGDVHFGAMILRDLPFAAQRGRDRDAQGERGRFGGTGPNQARRRDRPNGSCDIRPRGIICRAVHGSCRC